MKNYIKAISTVSICLMAIAFFVPAALAHCDTLDGPVVKAAQKALDTGDVNLVLIWVQDNDTADIRDAFNKTVAVRNLSSEAKDLADMYFFETLVRIHRSGEGAPYTGLKPAGLDMGPAIMAADKAIESGSSSELANLLVDSLQVVLSKGFDEVIAKKNYNPDDISAGREYVESYVKFIHYVERIYDSIASPAEEHGAEGEEIE